ncbi:hypothetical protein COB28_01920 [Candidatus Dependentiae bacterium]|nr:MAG: hypothetical protein COB28_01920 [Candidatus Dependentiae bacterium]
MTYFLISVISILLAITSCSAETSMILQLNHAPTQMLKKIDASFSNKKAQQKIENMAAHKLAQKLFKRNIKRGYYPTLSGFPALYAGYIDYSDNHGMIQFPLRHTSHRVFIAVSSKIDLQTLNDKTITALAFPSQKTAEENQKPIKKVKAEYFVLERKKLKNSTLFWNVQQIDLPKTDQMKKISIVLLTSPKNIVIPTGDFFIDPSQQQHYVLPPIYVMGNLNQAKTTIAAASILPFFETIDRTTINTPNIVKQSIISNQ